VTGVRKAFAYPGPFLHGRFASRRQKGDVLSRRADHARHHALYIVYYGQFSTGPNGTTTIINDFSSNVGGSGNYNVNTTYYDKNGKNIGIERIVKNALTGGHLPVETAASYFVVTAPDVTSSEIGAGVCAFHSNSTKLVAGTNIIYSAIPDFGGKPLDECDGNIQVFHETNRPQQQPGRRRRAGLIHARALRVGHRPARKRVVGAKGRSRRHLQFQLRKNLHRAERHPRQHAPGQPRLPGADDLGEYRGRILRE
jgi:hypothetical protein